MRLQPRAFLGFAALAVVVAGGTYARQFPSSYHQRHIASKTEGNAYPTLFQDATLSSQIRSIYERPQLDPLIQPRVDSFFVAPGFAVIDVNGDGLMDIFIPATSPTLPNKLYVNDGHLNFHEAAHEWKIDRNLSGPLAADSATTVDLDQDGRPDLILNGIGCTHVYMNRGDHFEDRSKESGLADCRNSTAALPFDIDDDGNVDIYMLRYWNDQDLFHLKDPHVYVNNLFDATNGGQDSVFINHGGGHFVDETATRGTKESHWSYDGGFGDFNDDGKFELYVSNDYGPDDFYQIENGKLVSKSDVFTIPDRRYGMNVSLGDLKGDGKPSLYISNAFEGPPFGLAGNFLWRFPEMKADDEAFASGVGDCDFAWGGAFGDYDLNGTEDLYVANGFVSTKIPPDQILSRHGQPETQLFSISTVRTLPGELSSDIRNWSKLDRSDRALHYRERDCLFMNRGGGNFIDVAESQHIDDARYDNRAVTAVDFDNDGDLDLAISSRNGPFTLLENTVNPAPEKWIGFSLKPDHHSANWIGARLKITQDGHAQYRWSTGGRNGFLASSDPRFHFGLTGHGPIDLEVHWRNGLVTKLPGLQAGRYYDVADH